MIKYDEKRTDDIVDRLVKTGNILRSLLMWVNTLGGGIILAVGGEVYGTIGAIAGVCITTTRNACRRQLDLRCHFNKTPFYNQCK